jgi:hypothetical protein
MDNGIKKPQIVLSILAGIGLLLPLIKVSYMDISKSASYIEADDGKIIMAIIVVAVLILCVRFKKDNLALKITSLVFIIGAGVLFWIDMSKVSESVTFIKSLSKDVIHYGIGYYMTLIGLILSVVLGILDLFSHEEKHQYFTDYLDQLDNMNKLNNATNNQPQNINGVYYQQKPINIMPNRDQQPVNNNVNTNNTPSVQPPDSSNTNNQVKLSDLINHVEPNQKSQTEENQTNIN